MNTFDTPNIRRPLPDVAPFDDDHELPEEASVRQRADTESALFVWFAVLLLGIAAGALLAYFGDHAFAAASMAGFVLRTRDDERLERVDSSALDIGLLIASGAMEPPHVAPQALTVTRWQRVRRWMRVRLGRWIYR